jgi:hypothetical protein
MYRVRGTGYAGLHAIPVAIDYTLLATSRDEALEKIRHLGVDLLQYAVTAVPDEGTTAGRAESPPISRRLWRNANRHVR